MLGPDSSGSFRKATPPESAGASAGDGVLGEGGSISVFSEEAEGGVSRPDSLFAVRSGVSAGPVANAFDIEGAESGVELAGPSVGPISRASGPGSVMAAGDMRRIASASDGEAKRAGAASLLESEVASTDFAGGRGGTRSPSIRERVKTSTVPDGRVDWDVSGGSPGT